MLIIPAIDLRAGRCVRLRQGNYADETVFGDDPAVMAEHWVSQGAERLHLVQYAVLAVLVATALQRQREWERHVCAGGVEGATTGGCRYGALVASLGVILLVGVIEEGLQTLLPDRFGSIRDVTLDLIGGLFGLGCRALWRIGSRAAF